MIRELLPVADTATVRAALRALLHGSRRLAAGAVVVLAAGTVAGLVLPPVVGRMTDAVLEGTADGGTIDRLATVLLLALLAQGVLAGWGAVLVARVGETALAALRQQVVGRALALPVTRLERAGTGDLVARVGDDVDALSAAVRDALPRLVRAVLTIGLTLVGLVLLHPVLAVAGLAAVPVQVLASRWYLRRSGPLYAAERAAFSRRAQQLGETVAGARTVRSLGLGARHVALVDSASGAALVATLRTARTGARFWAGLNTAELVGTASVLLAGYGGVRAGLVTVGEATAAALYFHGLFNPVGSLLSLLDTAQDATASLRRLVGVTALPTSGPAPGTAPAAPADGSVALRDVRFAYPSGPEVLHGVDLVVATGERLAVVGPSGAGKTTLAALVAGLHPPTSGSVRIGGSTHEELGPTGSRAAVVLVSQEVHVFAGTLADDLRLAAPDAPDDDLRAALRRVGALGWVDQLPQGLSTVVGEGGHPLTATRSQQLALARVALTAAPVVVLDEATAEAGSAGARSLEDATSAVTRGRTAVVVAHRLTQAAAADRVAVVEDGRVVETGAHTALAAGDGTYAALWRAWSAGRSPAPARPQSPVPTPARP